MILCYCGKSIYPSELHDLSKMFAVEAFEKALGITSKTISSMAHHKKDGRLIMYMLFNAHSRHKGVVINYGNQEGRVYWSSSPIFHHLLCQESM